MDRVLNHRYRLLDPVGQGAMGTMYRAHDVVLDRDVAVKILRRTTANETERARLLDEARAAARLNHPNIVAVYDAGQAGDATYIVMEMAQGHTLHERRPEHLDEIVRLAIQICAGLEHAHRHGIVHRDLKPENIMILAGDSVKIMDFGLAHAGLAGQRPSSGVTGTPSYLAPEQALGEAVDGRADLYTLGVILYELVAGELPFEGDDVLAVVTQHLHDAPVPPSAHNPHVPPALDALILQLLSKKPAGRPASAAETAERLQSVLDSAFSVARDSGRVPDARPLPAFMRREAPPAVQRTPVVAREAQLQQLSDALHRVLRGHGQMALITGEAGAGKTALVAEFVRRASRRHPHLLVAAGASNATAGLGDAYLPFREVLAAFTGDVEPGWATGLLTSEAAERLWAALPATLEALARHGPTLVDVLVPARTLIARLDAAGLADAATMAEVRSLLSQTRHPPAELEQPLIFEQYARVITAVAGQHPLLIFLDDLQWADSASIGLFYHLGRRLQRSRVFLLAAYRPDEVALGRGGDTHPLVKVLAELKRYGGEVDVDLDQARETEGRSFVDALVDTEPNELGAGFRDALYQLTGGHPLFTVELLRAMEERGELSQDREGVYAATHRLDWARLPVRVEGVIEERIARLSPELRRLLSVASVEGEIFTVEVLARVLDRKERLVLRQLGQELAGAHRLVLAQDSLRVNGQPLRRYRFRHNLFPWHLYHQLTSAERMLLHEDVATALEALYGESAREIAPQLAYHYGRAQVRGKAAHYLELAGNQARSRYAVEEAIDYYGQALALVPEDELETRYRLLLARESGHDLQGARDAEREDLASLAALAKALGDPGRRASVALRYAVWSSRVGDYAGMIEAAQRAVNWARESGRTEQAAEGQRLWGRGLVGMGDYEAARAHLREALELAQAGDQRLLVAHTFRSLGETDYYRGEYAEARRNEERAYAIYHELGERRAEGMTLSVLGMIAGSLDEHDEAWRSYERALAAFREVGDQGGESAMLTNLGYTIARQGNYAAAGDYYRQALAGLRDVGARPGEAITLCDIGLAALAQDDAAAAKASYSRALAIAREIGERWTEGYARTGLGQALALLGRLDEAEVELRQAVALREELNRSSLVMESRAELAQVYLSRGDLFDALSLVETILAYVDAGHDLGDTETPCLTLHICSRVLRAAGDSRSGLLLEKSYASLQEQAARLPDDAARRVFWEGVRWHRDIGKDWETQDSHD